MRSSSASAVTTWPSCCAAAPNPGSRCTRTTFPGGRSDRFRCRARAWRAARAIAPSRPNREGAMFGFGTEYQGLPFWLPLIWAGLIALAVAMYVIMDGFDLGVGILFNAAESENWRDRMMLSVAPIWDGNETWLILGGGGLLAVFNIAYAILLPALYVPLFAMLIALIFRGVAFAFRFKADRSRRIWDHAFHYGSLVATFAQGVVLGAFVQGFANNGRAFAGGTWDWLTPFSLLTGVSLVLGY